MAQAAPDRRHRDQAQPQPRRPRRDRLPPALPRPDRDRPAGKRPAGGLDGELDRAFPRLARPGQAREPGAALGAGDRRRPRQGDAAGQAARSTGTPGSATTPWSAPRSRRPIPRPSATSTGACSSPAASRGRCLRASANGRRRAARRTSSCRRGFSRTSARRASDVLTLMTLRSQRPVQHHDLRLQRPVARHRGHAQGRADEPGRHRAARPCRRRAGRDRHRHRGGPSARSPACGSSPTTSRRAAAPATIPRATR